MYVSLCILMRLVVCSILLLTCIESTALGHVGDVSGRGKTCAEELGWRGCDPPWTHATSAWIGSGYGAQRCLQPVNV